MFRRRQLLLIVFKLGDVALIAGAFALAALLVGYREREIFARELLEFRFSIGEVTTFLLLLVLGYVTFLGFGLYRSHRLASLPAEGFEIVKATAVLALLMTNLCALARVDLLSLRFVVVFWLLLMIAMIASRVVLRSGLQLLRLRGRNLRDVLIVGSSSRAVSFARHLDSRPELGYRVTGFVVRRDDPSGGHIAGYQVVCQLEDLVDHLRRNVVDEVVVAIPAFQPDSLVLRVIWACWQQGVTVRYLFELDVPKIRAETFEGEPVLVLYGGIAHSWQMGVKRLIDAVGAFVLLVLLFPLMLLIALAVKVSSKGPVLFVQYRVGLNKRLFPFYKFRTMVADAESMQKQLEPLNEIPGPVFKIKDDPRTTRLGRFLRRTSLDELPQLFNVLRGDMSLVGPRPLPERDYQGFDEDWHRRRFSVRPGLTCLWQIGGRSSVPFDRWMELDMRYIDNWSLWLDLKILARTVPAVLRGQGAA